LLRKIKPLFGFNILAEDGEIGKVMDIYFSDDTWTVRYLVVDTGPWILGRKVLVAVSALGQPDWDSGQVPVSLTREQVKNSPDMDTDKPVSRHQEIELHNYYNWRGYWQAKTDIPTELKTPQVSISPLQPEQVTITPEQGDTHLRSANEVLKYLVRASDGEAGQLEDFILDDETWFIRYLVVDTGRWLPGRKILIAPTWIEAVRGGESELFINIDREVIRESPEYDPNTPLAREYEEQLFGHYDQSKYWRQSS
jgi:hypothetical protein